MSRRDRWKSANEMGIDTWRHAPRLGRTAAERIALFTLRWSGVSVMAPALSARMRTGGDFHQRRRRRLDRTGTRGAFSSGRGTGRRRFRCRRSGRRRARRPCRCGASATCHGKMGSAIVISETAVMKMPALPALSGAQAGQVRT
jgi:hypothetical protein